METAPFGQTVSREHTHTAALFVWNINLAAWGWVLILEGIDAVPWDKVGINILNVWDCCGNM